MDFEIVEVNEKSDLKDFVNFPYDLYRGHPIWVPPLKSMAKKEFDREKNGYFKHADAVFFQATNEKMVGRIAAFVNYNYLKHYDDKVGFFGSFECIDDGEVAKGLVDASARFLKGRGLDFIRGPYNFTSQSTGLLIEGFDQPQTVLSPYNLPYYRGLLEGAGLDKIMDLNAYYGDVLEDYKFPERFQRHYDLLSKRYGVKVRTIDMSNIEEDVKKIVEVGNKASAGNWGFIPVDDPEIGEIVNDFRLLADPDAVFIMEKGERPVGYAVALPDVNIIIKKLNGRLFPFGIFRLKFGFKRLREYRLFALGLIPEFQNKALDTLLYFRVFDSLYKKNARLEASWIVESNKKMNQALVNMNFKLVKKFRVYQAEIDKLLGGS
jgi:hypothetical protein